MLQQWSAGDFDADYVPGRAPPQRIEDVPLAEQPDMLNRAALEFCLADAFHPGCEMTWPMRTAGLYMAPFRLVHAPRGLDRARLRPSARSRADQSAERAVARRPITGRHYALDGRAVANRHCQLPLRLPQILRSLRADLLASARSEPDF